MPWTRRRAILLLGVAVALVLSAGCATYWSHRGDDFAEMFDLGVTYSRKPYLVFYNSFESILTLGYGDYEATYYGWGGGQFGRTKHYLKAWGALVWGDEQVGWGQYDKSERSTLYTQNVGLVGMPVGMAEGNSNPHYVPT